MTSGGARCRTSHTRVIRPRSWGAEGEALDEGVFGPPGFLCLLAADEVDRAEQPLAAADVTDSWVLAKAVGQVEEVAAYLGRPFDEILALG